MIDKYTLFSFNHLKLYLQKLVKNGSYCTYDNHTPQFKIHQILHQPSNAGKNNLDIFCFLKSIKLTYTLI